MAETTGVLLAAGAGSRLGGRAKALLPYAGRTFVEHLAGVLRGGGCTEIVVVLGGYADQVRRAADLSGCEVVQNTAWAQGMSTSFRAGLAAVAAHRDAMVALVDQPGVTAETVSRLIAAHRPGRLTAAGYRTGNGTLGRGHPLIFDRTLIAEASASATGDAGARDFLRGHRHLIDIVDCSDQSDGSDVDTAADLELLS